MSIITLLLIKFDQSPNKKQAMKLSLAAVIATVVLLLVKGAPGAPPRKLDPDNVTLTDEYRNVSIRRSAPAQASLLPFPFDSSNVNLPISQPVAIPIDLPIRIEHEIDLGINTGYSQFDSFEWNNRHPSGNDRFLDFGFDSDDCKLPTVSSDSDEDSNDKKHFPHPHRPHFHPCRPPLPDPVMPASSPIDKLKWFDDEFEWIDGLYGDATSSTYARGLCSNDDTSVAAVDSSRPIPTAKPNLKKRKAISVEEDSDDTNEFANKVNNPCSSNQFIHPFINIINKLL